MFNETQRVLIRLKALVFYDYVLTYAEERKLVWQRKLSVATILFLLIRYISIAEHVALIVQVTHVKYGDSNHIDNVRGSYISAMIIVLICLFRR